MNKEAIAKLASLADSLDQRGFHKEADMVDEIIHQAIVAKAGAYTLTLSKQDRSAIDFVGDRYSNGTDLYKALQGNGVSQSPDDADWDDPRDITYSLPEHVAWGIRERAEEEDGGGEGKPVFPLFASSLVSKLTALCDSIV